MHEEHFINYRCNERSKVTKIKSEVGQIFKTTYHVFALSIESWRLSRLICLATACCASQQVDRSPRRSRAADADISNVAVQPEQRDGGHGHRHTQQRASRKIQSGKGFVSYSKQ